MGRLPLPVRRLSLLSALLAVCVAQPAQAARHGDRLILIPTDPDTIFTIEAPYDLPADLCPARRERAVPLQAKYRGRLELVRADDGTIRIVNELSWSHYLRGLAEVPTSWPMEALRAQVIAARSYALDAYGRERGGEYDICSTTACQVYRGATVELGPFGERWVQAVESTRGRVLRYRGDVIQAFYFSTSDGRTRSSFPGGTPQPWLPSVSGEDEDAPLGRWTSRIPLAHLARILDFEGRWGGGAITGVTTDGDAVVVRGASGTARVPKTDFRIEMNNGARCVYPDDYPPDRGAQGGGSLPETIPSTSFATSVSGDDAVFRGRGWGHFVGMSQWGAYSLARRDWNHRRILGHYYGPARIERIDEPSTLRVLAAESLRAVRIGIDGAVEVTTGTGSALAPGDRFEVRGGDQLRVFRGRGPTLRSVVDIDPARARVAAATGADVRVPFTLTAAARVSGSITDGAGDEVATIPERSFVKGRQAVTLPALEPGTYTLVLEAYDGLDRVRARPVAIEVAPVAATGSAPPAAPARDDGSPVAPIAVAAALALIVLVMSAVVWRNRLSRR